MENNKEFNDVTSLPEDFRLFDMFYIDVGVATQNIVNGPLTKKQTQKIMGEPLWEVRDRTIESKVDKKTSTIDEMMALAKQEKKFRSIEIAKLVDQGVSVGVAILEVNRIFGKPKYVGWGPKPNFKAFFEN